MLDFTKFTQLQIIVEASRKLRATSLFPWNCKCKYDTNMNIDFLFFSRKFLLTLNLKHSYNI